MEEAIDEASEELDRELRAEDVARREKLAKGLAMQLMDPQVADDAAASAVLARMCAARARKDPEFEAALEVQLSLLRGRGLLQADALAAKREAEARAAEAQARPVLRAG